MNAGEGLLDSSKAFWNHRPCNINHSKKPFGTREYFDEVEAKKYFVENHIPEFADFASWQGKHVLEIGCGIGTDAVNFAKNGAHYTGVDLSDKSLDISRERFKVYGLDGTFLCANAERLTDYLKERKYDLIYSFGVIHHSPNPDKIIEEVKKLLKPGGTFKMMVYAKNSWKKAMIDGGYEQYEAQKDVPVAFTYTQDEIHKLLPGFEQVQIKQEHIFQYKIDEYLNNVYEKLPWFECMPKQMIDTLEKTLGWHMCVTSKLPEDSARV